MNRNTRNKRQPKKPNRTENRSERADDRDQQQRSQGFDSSALTTMVNTVMSTASAGQLMQGTITTFAKAIDELTSGTATETVAQVQSTIEHAAITFAHAKETIDLGKEAYDSVRNTAKEVYAHVKENPEPFIAAAIPAVVGLVIFLRRSQAIRTGAPRARRSTFNTVNA